MRLQDLEVYQLSFKLSEYCWLLYCKFTWQEKKVVGDQFITAVDSIGANIAEGYGRFYFLDKIRFFYNSRGSLSETQHWVNLLAVRELINRFSQKETLDLLDEISRKLSNLISATYRSKQNY